MTKRALLLIIATAALSTSAMIAPSIVAPANAQAVMNLGVSIGMPPPAPVYEVVPPPRVGYVWAPGYWRWEHERHVWMPGRWVEERRGYHWVPDRWDREHENWRHHEGHWDRDRG